MASKPEDKEEKVEINGNEVGEPTENIQSPPSEATYPCPSRECPELRRERDDYPEAMPPYDKNDYGAAGPPIPPDGDYENTPAKNMGRRTCFRLRRRGLVIILLLVIIFIAAIIGGSVGGLLMSKRGPGSIAKPPEQRSIAAAECNGDIFVLYQDYEYSARDINIYHSNSSTWSNLSYKSYWGWKRNSPITLGCEPIRYWAKEWLLNIYFIGSQNSLEATRFRFDPDPQTLVDATTASQIKNLDSRSRVTVLTLPPVGYHIRVNLLFVSNETGVVSQFRLTSAVQVGFSDPIHDLRTYASSPMAGVCPNSDCWLYWINQQGYLEGGFKNGADDEGGPWAGGTSSTDAIELLGGHLIEHADGLNSVDLEVYLLKTSSLDGSNPVRERKNFPDYVFGRYTGKANNS
ncbi:hypothetical protein FQN55_008391 [Onygenales sp. PD_40]|nr:hypothetical protein FQN55_008391 [Onygenales sp. PD_40]